MEEIWKDIKDYEGLYMISNFGRLLSLPRQGTDKLFPKCRISKGYYVFQLHKDNIRKDKSIHRLVAETFIPNINNLETVNHIDNDKLNNNISNLEWMSREENTRIWKVGRKLSDEHKENIGKSLIGNKYRLGKRFKHSEETKKKISETKKNRS